MIAKQHLEMDKTNYIICMVMVFALTIITGCKKPYNPVIVATDNKYLVVEGIINTSGDSTFVKLSRTVKLSDATNTIVPELNAVVTIENDQGYNYTLQEAGKGLYLTPALNLPVTAKYRLRIKTSGSKEYLSDYVEAKATPEIDSINYAVINNGLQLYVNTHDAQNKTRYYRWDFSETWEYVAFYYSFYTLGDDGYPRIRHIIENNPENLYYCYQTQQSHQVVLGSTAKLAQDVLYRQPINFVPMETGKLSHGYSIFLKQYALTEEGFNYWQILQTNTEHLGSIFDAQPASLKGNIHNISDPNEPVIGFVSASGIKTMLLYVDPFNIRLNTPNYVPPPTGDACPAFTIHVAPEYNFKERLARTFANGDSVLLSAIQPMGAPAITAYQYAAKNCADCRAKAPFGNTLRPIFWPY